MSFQTLLREHRPRALRGAVFAVGVGLFLWWLPATDFFDRLSFDAPTWLSSGVAPDEVVMVEMDEPSYAELNQTLGQPWSRALHAALLDHLRTNDARMVVFDTTFSESNNPAAVDLQLAEAMRRHGRVVLGADLDDIKGFGVKGRAPSPPIDPLRAAAARWGLIAVDPGTDGVVRRHSAGLDLKPSLAWAVAETADAPVTKTASHQVERWLRYYGPGGTLRRVSYFEATRQPMEFYRGKTVFIGGRPSVVFLGQQTDQFPTPWKRSGYALISGMEIHATAFLNLLHGDWLTRLPRWAEFFVLVGIGLLAGAGLALFPPKRALVLAMVGMAVITAVSVWLFCSRQIWFAWAIPVVVQIPVAFAVSFWGHVKKLETEKSWLEAPLDGAWADPLTTGAAQGTVAAAPAKLPANGVAVPDHELLQLIGQGSYGEVWLARDVLGGYHAVKLIRRGSFPNEDPYRREFRGLQKFAPISRAHPGLVHVLHAGMNEAAGHFYYVMEAGDDERAGPRIDPVAYSPRNLARDLRKNGPLTPEASRELGLALSSALAYLHGQNLIHRDIKPSNIIFVSGRPKLADIGLVTTAGARPGDASYVGTEGYLPPEGPGTIAGDIFALGRVLSETLGEPEDDTDFGKVLREIFNAACAREVAQRPPSAQALHEALTALRLP